MEKSPKSILIIGGGAIGCEYANILCELGCSVTIVEMLSGLLPGEDRELGKRLEVGFKKRGIKILANTKVEKVEKSAGQFTVQTNTQQTITSEKILVSVGRRPNTQGLGLEKIGLALDKGRIIVDDYLRTNIENIYAAGDVTGGYLLAHVASYEGIIASENISGKKEKSDYSAVPNCIYTRPEMASVGLSEAKAKEQGIGVGIGKFPFQTLGKAHAIGETEGFVKLIVDEKSDKILGAQIMGPHATDLIAELSVVIKAGLTSAALAKTIHAHPTLPEAIMEAAEAVKKQAIHLV
jgi:dihydrolipoamide dehydrogenase